MFPRIFATAFFLSVQNVNCDIEHTFLHDLHVEFIAERKVAISPASHSDDISPSEPELNEIWANVSVCEAYAWLVDSTKQPMLGMMMGSTFGRKRTKRRGEEKARRQAVEMECDGVECSVGEVRQKAWTSDWVAVIHYADISVVAHTIIVQQVRQAIIWGASAVIMLAMNAESLKTMELSEALPRPVILISANISRIMRALTSTTHGMYVSIAALRTLTNNKQSQMFTNNRGSHPANIANTVTLTLWTTCGRNTVLFAADGQPPWQGTVCLDATQKGQDNGDGEGAQSIVHAIYATIFLGTFFLLVKQTRTDDHWRLLLSMRRGESVRNIVQQRRRIAQRVVNRMPSEHVRDLSRTRVLFQQSNPDDIPVCAICLDGYFVKQTKRILPCTHTFHTNCVDPWLIERRTCPLCKRNVIELNQSVDDESASEMEFDSDGSY